MKPLHTLAALTLAGLTFTAAYAEEGKPPADGKRPPRPMLENLVPPMLVDELNLTADQKSKLDELNAAFKKDAEALKEKRQASLEKFRAMLTDEQKSKLEAAKERMRDRMGKAPHGEKGERGNKGPKPPPAE